MTQKEDSMNIPLNGRWMAGVDRVYLQNVEVPGLVTNPCEVTKGTLWYKKEVYLPDGEWSHATLKLNGARFCPSVHINGNKVSEQAGGMAPTYHRLDSSDIKPGAKVVIEIALRNLNDVPAGDASKIPAVDTWRSNISSCIWDDVSLLLHGPARIKRVIPSPDLANQVLGIDWTLETFHDVPSPGPLNLKIEIQDADGDVILSDDILDVQSQGRHNISIGSKLKLWSVDHPVLYKLKATLSAGESIYDSVWQTLGIKEFKTHRLNFELNGSPIKLRAGSVVWHRWLRDPEAKKLAFDTSWFEENIVRRLKDYGANTLRFHLGTPPEALLDLCDRHGLMVQIEWLFFHGIEACYESILEQWRNWLDLCFKHPSICLIHPWNETESADALQMAFKVIDELSRSYPPMVMAHRDTLHLHKYWWSLFENIGLYYDSAEQFEQPCMVDEFGGNYLDGEGNPGKYPMVEGSLLRFLGADNDKAMRLELHADANAKIAEYWRRVGVAGFSPFCILGSPEDGNHHFLGKLVEAHEKPVWKALAAAYAPVSCSLETWDRNYFPGQDTSFQVYLFNDTRESASVHVAVSIVSNHNDHVCHTITLSDVLLEANSTIKKTVHVKVPLETGSWRFSAAIEQPGIITKHPVVSSWSFRTMDPVVPDSLRDIRIKVPACEKELSAFLRACELDVVSSEDADADIFIGSTMTWERLLKDICFKDKLNEMIDKRCSVLLLDVGPMFLGREYPVENNGLSQRRTFPAGAVEEVDLLKGLKISFTPFNEPESCIHPTIASKALWENMDHQATSLWNGLRGGLIVPAVDINLDGLNAGSLLKLWTARGADEALIKGKNYFAYELSGQFGFSVGENCETKNNLREKLRFLVEDSPSLQLSINPEAAINTYPLSEMYRNAENSNVSEIVALAACGKDLKRSPVFKVSCGDDQGNLGVSQLIMRGRLAPGFGTEGLYGMRSDPAAQQMLLNMISALLSDKK